MDKTLARLPKTDLRDITQIHKIINERGDITTNTTEIQNLMRLL